MGKTVITFLAIYMLVTGWNGNARNVAGQVKTDAPGFIPWILAIISLMFLNQTRARPLVNPFITLALVSTAVTKFPVIKKSVDDTLNVFKGN